MPRRTPLRRNRHPSHRHRAAFFCRIERGKSRQCRPASHVTESVQQVGDKDDELHVEEIMRPFNEDARRLLVAASNVARFRGAQECDRSDIQVASLLTSLHPGLSLYPDAATSSSPLQLPFASDLQELLVGSDEELGIEELKRFAEEH